MNRLLAIGFQPSGHWHLDGDELAVELIRNSKAVNILYAFACDGEVKYVGKARSTLEKRMYGYRRPVEDQATNLRNNHLIRKHLSEGEAVDILTLPDNGLMHIGQFHLNLADGLESSIIQTMKPPWNGTKLKQFTTPHAHQNTEPSQNQPEKEEFGNLERTDFRTSFSFVLQHTYWKKGNFNVLINAQQFIGEDGETIEILLPGEIDPIVCAINRACNKNRTPRIMGGKGLRDWFQKHATPMETVEVQAFSRTSIRLRMAPKFDQIQPI